MIDYVKILLQNFIIISNCVVVLQAVSDGSLYNGMPLTMAWQSADGVLSPKIVVPPRSSVPTQTTRTLSTGRSQTTGTSSTTSAATVEETRLRQISISKLLEVKVKHKGGVTGNSLQSYGVSPAIWDHTVLNAIKW